uniref:Putative transcriptional regulator n=1 Tax=Streptomyces versipellis TaxID=67375 RepID=A0A0B6VRG6_9ACTN|nr:putative transcriptional regulator [Streptomyces versipellis]
MAGRGNIAYISGPVGCGKTAILRKFGHHVERSGALLLTATASRAERNIPMGVVGQLFQTESLSAECRRRVDELLGQDAVGAEADRDPETIRKSDAAVAYGLCTILLQLARHRPIVVVVDDLQHADGASLQTLLYLHRRMTASRMMLLFSEQSMVRSPHPLFHSELFGQPNFSNIRVGLLSRSGVREVTAARLGAVAPQLADYFANASGGSPLLLSAMIDDHQAVARLGSLRHDTQFAAREALTLALSGCLRRSESSVVTDVAQALAVLGEPAPAASLGRLLKIGVDTVEHALASLTAAGLLKAERFRHPAARTIILESMSPEQRRDLHLRAAAVLHDDGLPPIKVAEQLIAAGQAPAEWMVGVLRDAANMELADDRLEAATECLELALSECTGLQQRAELTAARARIEWRNSPSRATRYIRQLRWALGEGCLGDREAGTLIRYLLWDGRIDEAREAMAVWCSSPGESDRVVAEELATIGWWYPALFEGAGPAPERSPEGVPGSMLLRFFGGQTMAPLAQVTSGVSNDDLVVGAESVLQSNRLDTDTLELLHAALLIMIRLDHPDRAAPWCESLLAEARARGAATWEALFAALRSDAAVRQGDLATAVKYGESAVEGLTARDWGVAIGDPLANMVLASTLTGRYAQAAGYLKQPVPDTMFETRFGLQYLNSRGHFHLATGSHQAALADFENCGRLMGDWGLDLPTFIPWRTGAAEAYLRLGKADAARALIEEQLSGPGGTHARVRGASLRLLAGVSDLQERPALLKEAVSLLQSVADRLELARALVDLSRTCQRLGDFAQARRLAEQALETGPYAVDDPTSGELPPSAPNGADALSEAERRVAELAAGGHTNREIARQLFITVSTVEQHLTRVYRKLSVSRRTDLVSRLPADTAGSA